MVSEKQIDNIIAAGRPGKTTHDLAKALLAADPVEFQEPEERMEVGFAKYGARWRAGGLGYSRVPIGPPG